MKKSASLIAGAAAVTMALAGGLPAFALGDNDRVGGADRIDTAIKVMKSYKNWGNTLLLVRSDDYADALSASVLSAALNAPVLLTGRDALDSRVEGIIKSSGFTQAYLVGGDKALSGKVQSAVAALGLNTTRIAGANRYATSIQVANWTKNALGSGNLRSIFVARGDDFADALAAGATAARNNGVLVLVPASGLNSETRTWLDANNTPVNQTTGKGVRAIVAAGGTAAKVMDGYATNVVKVVGADRYETAAKLAEQFDGVVNGAVIASGENWPDALSVAGITGKTGKALLLSKTDALPKVSGDYLAARKAELGTNPLNVIGGPVAIADAVAEQAAKLSGGALNPADRWVPSNTKGTLLSALIATPLSQTVLPSRAAWSGHYQALNTSISVTYTGSSPVSSLTLTPDANNPTSSGSFNAITASLSGTTVSLTASGTSKVGTYKWKLSAPDADPITIQVTVVNDVYEITNGSVTYDGTAGSKTFTGFQLSKNGTVLNNLDSGALTVSGYPAVGSRSATVPGSSHAPASLAYNGTLTANLAAYGTQAWGAFTVTFTPSSTVSEAAPVTGQITVTGPTPGASLNFNPSSGVSANTTLGNGDLVGPLLLDPVTGLKIDTVGTITPSTNGSNDTLTIQTPAQAQAGDIVAWAAAAGTVTFKPITLS